ncbi:flagellar biosynthesis protein FlhF [Aliidiomarina iranensis]|uniref:Flagellar biosynthesis protein FlhF n=1 Tax=Aliidiomarina iranensis TaxID=1434071 RepID=A0A432W1X5_9GAMM|nr:flagellar biosynthesis protein FlhF [Aliidiomarina iranensis]RUO23224.1 flagellar biosynthesis protein FlhF [Aliidiomarina iranensis]
MSVRRYFGANNRDAMRQVRESLGPDAMILSSRQLDDGYEILAMAEDALDEKVAQADKPPANDFAALAQRLLSEVQEMRSMLNNQQKKVTPTVHPIREMVNILQAAGFGTELIRELAAALPGNCNDVSAWLHEQLQQRIQLPSFPAELFSDGVIALVGPTGVGKTTTTAKLAAHYVMQFGPEQLLLVTTDGYRVGAREQLKIYAGLLEVDMHALEEGEKLDVLQDKMCGKKLVLIDTVGMSQRDQRLTQRIAELQAGAETPAATRPLTRETTQKTTQKTTPKTSNTRLVLVLNTASQRENLDEVVCLFQRTARESGMVIRDCIVSKVDESVRLGGALDVLIRHGLILHFVSNGQRVPEDLELPDTEALVNLALNGVAAEYAEFSQWLANFGEQSATPARAASGALQAQGKTVASLYEQLRADLPGFDFIESLLNIGELPANDQEAALTQWYADIQAEAGKVQPKTLHWARTKPVAGVKWHLANLPADIESCLLPLPILPEPVANIAKIHQNLGVQQHIFQMLPSEATLNWLNSPENGLQPWVAVINRNHRFRVRNADSKAATNATNNAAAKATNEKEERVAALALRTRLNSHHSVQLHYRGEAAKLTLGSVAVKLMNSSVEYQLWYGELAAEARGAGLVRRFWLLPKTVAADTAKNLIVAQLKGDEAASLTRQTHNLLQKAGYEHLSQPVSVALATTLAASAIHVEQSMAPVFNTARQRLFNLSGKRGKANGQKILAGLIQLLEATVAIQIMSAAGVRSE